MGCVIFCCSGGVGVMEWGKLLWYVALFKIKGESERL